MSSLQPSPPTSPEHSTEVEHRLTVVEQEAEHVKYRLSLHEKAILVLAGGLYILYQDRFPALGEAIRRAMP